MARDGVHGLGPLVARNGLIIEILVARTGPMAPMFQIIFIILARYLFVHVIPPPPPHTPHEWFPSGAACCKKQ